MITSLPPHLPRKNSLHLLEFVWRGEGSKLAVQQRKQIILSFSFSGSTLWWQQTVRVLTEKMWRLHWVPVRFWTFLFEKPSLSVSGALLTDRGFGFVCLSSCPKR